MNKSAPAEFDEVLARVTAWPPDNRVELARKVLDTVHPANGAGDVTQPTADEVINTMRTRYPLLAAAPARGDLRARLLPLIGLASAGKPPPSDADIKQWSDEQSARAR